MKTNTFEMDELIEKQTKQNTNFSKGKIGCGKDFCKLYILERTKIEGIKRKKSEKSPQVYKLSTLECFIKLLKSEDSGLY